VPIRLPFVLSLLAFVPAALAQDPAAPCPSFEVTTSPSLFTYGPDVASRAEGDFVVVWQSYTRETGFKVVGQRFDPGGDRVGAEFEANAEVGAHESAVAMAPDGSFMVVWTRRPLPQVAARAYDPAGVPRGPELLVSNPESPFSHLPSVVADGRGNFVVVWSQVLADIGRRIFGRRFGPQGEPLGGAFRVDDAVHTSSFQPDVAARPTGEFVVVWSDVGGPVEIFGQRYDAEGARQGAPFVANPSLAGHAQAPSIAMAPSGEFLVAWESVGQLGTDERDIFAQRLDADATLQGPEIQVNSATTGLQVAPSVTRDSRGNFVVAWGNYGYDPYRPALGRRIAPDGTFLGPEFQLSRGTTGGNNPAVAPAPHGGFVAVWDEYGGDPPRTMRRGLECARFTPLPPCRLADTRGPAGPGGGPPLAAGAARNFPVAGSCGIPVDARAVAFNATVASPTGAGNLRLYPAGEPPPLASMLNFAPGRARANSALLPLGPGGEVTVRADMPLEPAGTAHLVLDVYGYFKR
jgi:hypothetical protein